MLIINEKKNPLKLLFFGYPSETVNCTGGFLWMKKVADYIEKSNNYSVSKILNQDITNNIPYKIVTDLYNSIRAFTKFPDMVVIDAWGESNIVLWLLLKTFKPKTKILVIFHHHEERILFCRNVFEIIYNRLIRKATSAMLTNSDTVLTVSQSSKHQLNTIYGVGNDKIKMVETLDKNTKLIARIQGKKIVVVGTGIEDDLFHDITNSNNNHNNRNKLKDIDFLCIGRIEKFFLLEEIWMRIKTVVSNPHLVVIGRASPAIANKLKKLGIDYRGFVSDQDKINLYSRAKVFIFPSSMEGFGIAVAEALYFGLPVIAWDLPVFKELYTGKQNIEIKLIEYGDQDSFAEKCIEALNGCKMKSKDEDKKRINIHFPKWQTVAQNVMSVIEAVKRN